VEAKENVRVREETQTVASITFQNYFRLYKKLSGMTGTADTEAPEFLQIYGLEVVVIPTHRPMIRKDMPDLVHLTQDDKYTAILEDIRDCVARRQPVLVGTTSIESSELIAGILKKDGVAHEVLNAKQHEREAHIVAQAGQPGAVTIATNMAGRGTDIQLGGNFEVEIADLLAAGETVDDARRAELKSAWQKRHDEVLASGGLHIIGTERHESRRIDNQLRGRSGRQGDPGSTRFYLSMEDTLMRIFGDPNRTKRLLQLAGMKQGEVIESNMLTRQIEKAQRKVEAHNFDIRKQLLMFDDVANDQRKVVYQQRTGILGATDLSDAVAGMREEAVNALIGQFVPPQSSPGDWDLDGLAEALRKDFSTVVDAKGWLAENQELDEASFRQRTIDAVNANYDTKVERFGAPLMRQIEREIVLRNLDQHWREHLAAMDYLRQGIHLRGYAQKDYRYEFKREAFELFSSMLDRVKHESASQLTRVEVRDQAQIEREEAEQRERLMRALQAQHAEAAPLQALPEAGSLGDAPLAPPTEDEALEPFVRGERKVGRNEPCPCGSGKKYKQCHGSLSA
jgi:preprotein translocase subunit SecA